MSFFKSKKGFTLAELLVSLFILIIITGLSINSFNVWQRNESLRQGALEVLANLREAQAWALAGKPYNNEAPSGYGLVFYPNDNHYLIFADLDGDGLYASSTDGLIGEKYLPSQVAISQLVPLLNNSLTIDFTLPLARIKVNGDTTAAEAKVYLKQLLTGEIKYLTIKRITGQISLDNY